MRAFLLTTLLALSPLWAMSQETDDQGVDATTGATRQVTKKEKQADVLSRLHIGGYGEAVMTRNFYSQSFNRYKKPENYVDDKSHGRFDLPHVCLNIGYDFGFLSLQWYTNFAGNDGLNSNGDRAYSSYFELSAPFRLGGLDWSASLGVVPSNLNIMLL